MHAETRSSPDGHRLSFTAQVVDPKPIGEEPICIRVEKVVRLKLFVNAERGHPFPWDTLVVPATKSVKKTVTMGLRLPLELSILLTGVNSRRVRQNACSDCLRRVFKGPLQLPSTLGIVDYKASSNFISIKDGVADLAFRFTCYPQHHSRKSDQDSEWM